MPTRSPPPRGGEWRASTITGSPARGLGVLRNPIYVGRYLYNRVTMKRDPETRRRISRPSADGERVWMEVPDLRIVDEESWRRAWEIAESHAMVPLNARPRPRYLLTGLITCRRMRRIDDRHHQQPNWLFARP
ncbi:recombinase family protein [Sphingomonas sp. S-NIH.Pt15_0812]|uniref:recombinase family protein n=1 Tax=Sphingomonas sp. S-NIH.Pt15_0812 TaxID=1920129 RepID=UPI000F7D9095|nr:recombinase family protein [Sphingomonas sp. S-NIH.Pt15_0812]RSU48117.1 hypothetical protein BRX43_12895 [Sphingomonas sp. S-NIH.Pt15_0812]